MGTLVLSGEVTGGFIAHKLVQCFVELFRNGAQSAALRPRGHRGHRRFRPWSVVLELREHPFGAAFLGVHEVSLDELGVVGEKNYLYRDGVKDPLAVIEREIGCNQWVQKVMHNAEQFGETWVTGEYSYRSEHSATDGLVLTGDAFSFMDPVFSTGVFLALISGELAADAIHEALAAGDVSATHFEQYTDQFQHAIEAMRKLVYAFYTEGFSFGKLLKKHPHLRSDLTDCLIGKVSTDFTALFDGVAEFVDVPKPLTYGRPLIVNPQPSG